MRKLLQQSPALAEMLRDGGELDEPVGGKAELVAATGTQPPLLRIPPRDWEASRPPGSSARLTQPSSKAPSRSRRALRPSATSRYVLRCSSSTIAGHASESSRPPRSATSTSIAARSASAGRSRRSDRYRHLELPDDLFAALVATLPPREDRDLEAPLFDGLTDARLRTAITRACRATGTPHFSPYGLRRRRGSLHSKRTGSLADVAELLGDSKRGRRRALRLRAHHYREVDRSIALARVRSEPRLVLTDHVTHRLLELVNVPVGVDVAGDELGATSRGLVRVESAD
jgi:hypothetical protein